MSDETLSRKEQIAAIKTMARGYLAEGVSIVEIDNLLLAKFPGISRRRIQKYRREAFSSEALTDEDLVSNLGRHKSELVEMYRVLFFKANALGKITDARQILKEIAALKGLSNVPDIHLNLSPGLPAPDVPKLDPADIPTLPAPLENSDAIDVDYEKRE